MSDKSHRYIEQMTYNYGPFLSLAAFGIHYQLFLMRIASGDSKSVPLENLISITKLPAKVVHEEINALAICNLIERKKRKDGVSFLFPKDLKKEEMIELADKCISAGLIPADNRPHLLEAINASEEQRVKAIRRSSESKPFNFEEGEPTKETAPSLVFYYYKILNQTFGGNYSSYNLVVEASALKKIMQRTGDTAEQTKKMFEHIIKRAHQHNRFADVSSMKFYGNQRNSAHRALFSGIPVNSPIAKPVVFSEQQKLGKIESLYRYYVEKQGMGRDEAVAKIKETYSGAILDKFLEGLNEKQIHVSERTVQGL
jgi:hypothetical protein